MMGFKQISQLSFFDYVVGISIGSIAAEMASNKDIPFHFTVIAMLVYASGSLGISVITRKSIKARRFLTGTPIVMIERGKIIKENMKRAHYDMNDLLCQCRISGYFNISDIEFAIMETTGDISFIPKGLKKQLTPEDMSLNPKQEEVLANVIIDGRIMWDNLKNIGRNQEWLDKKLAEQKIKSVKEVLLATCDEDGNLSVFLEHERAHKNNVFE
jgi:uncharacterized membrane protein YcaP (DUF421 family)